VQNHPNIIAGETLFVHPPVAGRGRPPACGGARQRLTSQTTTTSQSSATSANVTRERGIPDTGRS
jgi:hypothetical protein